jgi:hypothetical protein
LSSRRKIRTKSATAFETIDEDKKPGLVRCLLETL